MSQFVPSVSVVVSASQSAGTVAQCLRALVASTISRSEWELIVVDDASTDDTPAIAAAFADLVIRLPGKPRGVEYARNRGVELSRGAMIVFVSADVCVNCDTVQRLVDAVQRAPDVAAVSGAYDFPSASGPLRRFQVLYNLFLFEEAAGETDAFFAGLGAIRKDVLVAAGMFDEWHDRRPRVVASELGQRIRALGFRLETRPDARGVHLRRRSLRETIRLTLRDHGVPYETLAVSTVDGANARLAAIRRTEHASRALTWLTLVSVVAAVAAGAGPGWIAVAILGAAYLALTFPLLGYIASREGIGFALLTIPLHFGGFLLSGASRSLDRLRRALVGEPRPDPTIEAFAEVGVETWPPMPRRRAFAVAPPATVTRVD